MAALWTEFPQLDKQLEEEEDDGDHLNCDCGTPISFCGAYLTSVIEYQYKPEDICRDCWGIYEQGQVCAWCGQYWQA